MIDPVRITDYRRTVEELEELLLFCILVAGKNATRTSISLERLLQHGRNQAYQGTPFEIVKSINQNENLPEVMRGFGFGCYNVKSQGLIMAANSGLDLKKCSVADLEGLYGVGMKTARFFVLHTRRNARVACLDTHVLKWLAYFSGYDVPHTTPSKTKYLLLEQVFLGVADALKISPADLDLKIWNKQRGSDSQ